MNLNCLWQMDSMVVSRRFPMSRFCPICEKEVVKGDLVVRLHTDGWSSDYPHYNCFLMALRHKFPEIKLPKKLEMMMIVETL